MKATQDRRGPHAATGHHAKGPCLKARYCPWIRWTIHFWRDCWETRISLLAEGSAPGGGRKRSSAAKGASWCQDRALAAPDRGGAAPGRCPSLESRGIIHRVH